MAKIEIDPLEPALDTSGDGDHENEDVLGMVEEGSFVTYRLVQVGSEEAENVDSPAEAGASVLDSPGGTGSDKEGRQLQTLIANPVNGQLIVIGNSTEVYSSALKGIIPREGSTKTVIGKKRDDRRRATHNEVERRRRDKINNWILRLSSVIPPSADDKSNSEGQSKGGILAKACEYIIELKNSNERLKDSARDNEMLTLEIVKLNQQLTNLRRENTNLRRRINQGTSAPNTPAGGS